MSNNVKRRGMSPVVAFILGFLLALVVVAGAVVGVVFYALNYKLDKLEFNKDEENNYIYVNADPEGDTATLLQLVNKVASMTSDTSNLSLGQVEETFPVVSKLSDAILNLLGEYADIDNDELKATAFSQLGDFLQDTVLDIRVADLLNNFAGDLAKNELLSLVLYDEENNPVTVRSLSEDGAFDRLYDKPVLDFIGDGDFGEITEELLDGTTLGDLIDGFDFGDKANSLTLDVFVEANLSEGKPSAVEAILSYIIYGITDIEAQAGSVGGREYTHVCAYNPIEGEKISPCYIKREDGAISEVFYMGAEVIEEVKGTAVRDISARASDITNDMTLGQLIDVSGNKILGMIADSTISGLSEDINGLAVNQLYADNIYTSSAKAENEEVKKYLAVSGGLYKAESCQSGYIYYLKDGDNYSLASITGKLSSFESGKEYYTAGEGKILFDTAYVYYGADGKILNKGQENAGKALSYAENLYTYGAANSMWKLLLYSDGSETAFSVNGFTKMIDNVSENIESATIYELDDAGIIDMSANKDKVIVIGEHSGKRIGELTLKQLLDFFSDIVSVGSLPISP